jgi:Fe-S-cluster containining protein
MDCEIAVKHEVCGLCAITHANGQSCERGLDIASKNGTIWRDSVKDGGLEIYVCDEQDSRVYFCRQLFEYKGGNTRKEYVVSKVLDAYGKIGGLITRQERGIACRKVCKDGCSDAFSISVTEFFAIVCALGIGSHKLINYSKDAKRRIAEVYAPNNANVPNWSECILVDDMTDECKAYSVKPSVCRTYGLETKPLICWFSELSDDGFSQTEQLRGELRGVFRAFAETPEDTRLKLFAI